MTKTIRIVTHNGKFHVDELLAVAALSIFLGDVPVEIIRTRDPEVIASGDYAVDVGGIYDPLTNRFDHHQHGGAGEREGVPYSSFGLVWKHFGLALSGGSQEVWEHIERRVAYPVDFADNGVEVYTLTHPPLHPYLLHHFVNAFRPTWKEENAADARFLELVPIMRRLLEREIAAEQDNSEGRILVHRAYEASLDKQVIVLDDFYPWEEVLAEYPEPLYVVKPRRQSSDWSVDCVRDDAFSFTNRKSFPESWRGARDEELARITGVPDAVFCHNKGFIAVAKSKEGALTLAQLARDA